VVKAAEQEVTVTPSGLEILYQWEPKRLYKVREPAPYGQSGVPDFTDWLEVPSVTTVLGVLDKPALPWWGMRVGIEGVLAMHNMGLLASVSTLSEHQKVLAYEGGMGTWHAAGIEKVEELLTKHKLTVNHVRDKAGDRGTAVHDALEVWAKTGELPDPSIYPPQQHGYVLGLIAFLTDTMLEPEAAEVIVGSAEYGFAGRYDLRARVPEESQVVFHRTPVKGAQYATIKPGLGLIDLKTSKGIYPSHARQLEAYEQASVECGYEPTDFRGILHVGPEGTYEFVRSWATFEDFRVVLDVWKSDEAMKLRKKEGK
jgi:hypothetical protein